MKKLLALGMLIPTISFAGNTFVTIISKDNNSYDTEGTPSTPDPDPTPTIDYSQQAWMNIHSGISAMDLYPAVADGSGSTSESTTYDFNFGQRPFLGDSLGFASYDENYDKSKWIGCVVDANNYCAPANTSSAKYDKSHPSGQFYFEFTLKGNPIGPHVEFMGMFNRNQAIYYSGIGASRVGTVDGGGYHYTNGDGTHSAVNKGDLYKSTGITSSGTTMQVWIDYDTHQIAIMELGTTKSDYQNFINR